jgi:hypothetical protein
MKFDAGVGVRAMVKGEDEAGSDSIEKVDIALILGAALTLLSLS